MKNFVIIKTGDSIPSLVARRGDFEDWIIAGMGDSKPSPCPIFAVHKGDALPDIDSISGIIITGSHAMITDQADWSKRTADWLLAAVRYEIPVLGICYGHQILAYALGGKVGYMPGGPEFGTVSVSLTADAGNDPLFANLPQTFGVQTSHYQSVTELPPMSVLLAFSEKDAHSAFRYGNCTWGVQFHPEYDADIANAYVNEFNEGLNKAHQDADALPLNCMDTTDSRMILSRFAAFATGVSK